MPDFTMPTLGSDMDAGTLVEWRVRPGDRVTRGQIVADVETQKGIIEVEIWQDGVVRELVVAPGTTVPVGTVLATLEGEPTTGAAPPSAPAAPTAPPVTTPSTAVGSSAPDGPTSAPRRASPAARQRARELGVALEALVGTGPHGAVTLADVETAARPSAPRPAASPGPAIRQAIAAAMSRANREIPHYHLATDVDMTAALAWLQDRNATRPVEARLLPAVLLVKAVARACREVPALNGFWIDGGFRPGSGIHVGFAIALRGGGLVAPALKDADTRDVEALMADLAGLILRTRGGGLRSSELAEPTITVTSLGERGVEVVHGVILPPQVALVGFGRVTSRPAVVDGEVRPRALLTATLAGDHRATDGHEGSAFLHVVRRTLQEWS